MVLILAILHSQQILSFPPRHKAAEKCCDGDKVGVRDYGRHRQERKRERKNESEIRENKYISPWSTMPRLLFALGSPLHLYFTSNLPDPSCLPIDFNIL